MENNEKALMPSEAVQHLFNLEGKPYSLKDFFMFEAIYNSPHRKILIIAGRQVSKSTTLSVMIPFSMYLHDFFRVLYISPSARQTSIFVKSRLDPIIKHSSKVVQNKLKKGNDIADSERYKNFANGSEFYSSYIGNGTNGIDRIRGVTADFICFDEVQSLPVEGIENTLKCNSASQYKHVLYTGTAMGDQNIIEELWSKRIGNPSASPKTGKPNKGSTMYEWHMLCEHEDCGYWNIPSADMIEPGVDTIVCAKCKRPIDPAREGNGWFGTNPNMDYDNLDYDLDIAGFRVPQIIMPSQYKTPSNWKSIISDKLNMEPARFQNEVLGHSSSGITAGFPLDKLLDCSYNPLTVGKEAGLWLESDDLDDLDNMIYNKYVAEEVYDKYSGGHVYAGIDWGGGTSKNSVSRTAIAIFLWAPRAKKHVNIYGKVYDYRMQGPELHADLAEVLKTFQVDYVMADLGGGAANLPGLAAAYRNVTGMELALYSCMYTAGNKFIRRDPNQEVPGVFESFQVNRSAALDLYSLAIEHNKVWFFKETEYTKELFKNYTSVYKESVVNPQDGTEKIKWKLEQGASDDYLHASVYAFLISCVMRQELEIE